VKILFSTSSYGFLRNFQSSIRRLAEQGHHIHLLAERSDTVDGQKMADALVAEYPERITASFLRSSRHRLWYTLGTGLRRRSTTGATSIRGGMRRRSCARARRRWRRASPAACRDGRSWVARQPDAAVAVVPRGGSAPAAAGGDAEVFERERPDLCC
jgi:hypothetical protein